MAEAPSYALYYPSIEFQDYEWLWAASLLWDGIYRIVPEGYRDEPAENVAVLMEDGEIGRPIRPGPYAEAVGKQFLHRLEEEWWDASALSFQPHSQEYRLIHREKIDVAIREMLISGTGQSGSAEWLKVPREFAALYMTYLARDVARRNNLELASDSLPGYTASTYFHFDGLVEPEAHIHGGDFSHILAYLIVEDFLPQNLLAVSPEAIVAFRKAHADERRNFLRAIRDAASRISKCEDPLVVNDLVRDLKGDIQRALGEYRASARMLNVTGWTGIKALSIPVAGSLFAYLTQADPTLATVLVNTGIALGSFHGIRELQGKHRELSRKSDFSYLLHLKRRFSGVDVFAGNLRYAMTEFVVD